LRLIHYITIASGIALGSALYFGGNTVPPPQPAMQGMPGAMGGPMNGGMRKQVSFDTVLATSLKRLSPEARHKLETIAAGLAKKSDSAAMVSDFNDMAKIWAEEKDPKIAAHFKGIAAKLENSEKNLTFAARLFLELLPDEENPDYQSWESSEAVAYAQLAVEKDSASEDAKLALATGYLEGSGEPMKGVQLLLGIVRERPDDIPANLLLGKMSVRSGQMDKAVGRLETVLKQEPQNTEALYYLAQAYKGKGDKAKALELLQKCKKAVNDPEFDKKADEEMNSLK
jgi:tetratricopeptide (TPR) repeat protein